MTQDHLHDLIAQGEGPALEFKRSLRKNLGRELCAFANSGGGTLLIGISGGGRIVGVDDHNSARSHIRSVARSADPPIDVEIDDAGAVLHVTIPPQHHKPYSFRGRFFRRDGPTSQRMSRGEIENLFYEAGRLHFDRTPCPAFTIERHLDDETWTRFTRRAKIPVGMDRIAALLNLGLIDARQRVTHAGAWLMAPDIRAVTTSAHVSCALFLGRTKSRILDRREFHRDLPSTVDNAAAWVLSKINVGLVIRGTRREEVPELPEVALREALANAVAHRDYRSPANVQVHVFKDRVEIVSPGGLPAGMTEADLGTKSVPRNPLLFGMLYRMGVVENIGSGIRRILDRCREHGAPQPAIEVAEHRVTVTFPRADQEDDGEDCKPESHEGDGPENGPELKPEMRPESGAEASPKNGCPETPVRGSLDMRVLALLVDGPLSKSAIARRLGHRSVSGGLNRVIRRLRRDGHVEYTLPEKPNSSRQQYRLTETGSEALARQDP